MRPRLQSEVLLGELETSLCQLSWVAERKIAHVRNSNVEVDELALEFDDLFRTVKPMTERDPVLSELIEPLEKVDEQLATMTQKGLPMWQEESVRKSREWEELRAAAHYARSAVARARS